MARLEPAAAMTLAVPEYVVWLGVGSLVWIALCMTYLACLAQRALKSVGGAAAKGVGLNPAVDGPTSRNDPAHATEPSAHWYECGGRWLVHHAEGDIDSVLGCLGYGPVVRSAFRLANYGAGIASLEIAMHGPQRCTLTFGGGPMPETTNTLRVDGSTQQFVGNEGIPGDDVYTVAMWWEGDAMVAWGKHTSGRFPVMDTRRFLRHGPRGEPFGELVVDRTVEGHSCRMIYSRSGSRRRTQSQDSLGW